MGTQFVPLIAPTKSPLPVSRPGPSAAAAPGHTPVFTPISFGPASSASTPPTPPSVPCAAPAAAPEVSFKRDGDRITQIQIRCSCGESLVLDCDYNQLQ